MNWINDLLWGEGIGHSILLLSFVIAAGIQLGKIKVFGVSLGITLVLFVGIILGHFGFTINHNVIHFFKEFGLILFVYSVGMQVGPGFFSSFKQGGITLNMLACGIVFLGVLTAVILHYATGIPMPTMVGILSGAVTNTPGLGAAQQAFSDMHGVSDNTIALGYAVAYPLGVIGIILSIILIKYIFRVSFDKENEQLNSEDYRTCWNIVILLFPVSGVIATSRSKSLRPIPYCRKTTRFLLSRLRRMPRRSRPLSEKRSIWNVNSGSVWKANLSTAVS